MNFFFNCGEEADSLELLEHRFPGLSETELERGGAAPCLGPLPRKSFVVFSF